MSQRALSRGLFAFFALAVLAFCGGALASARAAAPDVTVGEVRVQSGPAELESMLRVALTEELLQLGPSRTGKRGSLVVSATLVRMSSEQRAQNAKASAAISLAVRRADDQVLFAELLGRASAEETPGQVSSVRKAALRAAVRSAVARLPEAAARAR